MFTILWPNINGRIPNKNQKLVKGKATFISCVQSPLWEINDASSLVLSKITESATIQVKPPTSGFLHTANFNANKDNRTARRSFKKKITEQAHTVTVTITDGCDYGGDNLNYN